MEETLLYLQSKPTRSCINHKNAGDMKRRLTAIVFIALLIAAIAPSMAQSSSYEYSYDAAGNRIRRAVVPLHKGTGAVAEAEGTLPDGGMPLFGTALIAFPNPTTGTVRLETGGASPIAGYRLYDARGVLLEQGRCGAATMTLDLSARTDGVYLIEVTVGTERRHIKIIKQ